MVTNLQFAAVAAYLLWCLVSALTGVFDADNTEAGVRINESDKTGNSLLPGITEAHDGRRRLKGVR